jgi:hypothetical protein
VLGDGGDQAVRVEARGDGGAALQGGLVGGGREDRGGHGATYGAPSPGVKDWIKGRVAALDAWARPWAERGRLNGWAYEFLLFGLKQAWACLFGGLMLALIVGTHLCLARGSAVWRATTFWFSPRSPSRSDSWP